MTPLERAARAMLDSNRIHNGLLPDAELNDMTVQARADYLRQARAVIEAIREPSEAMLGAADYVMPGVTQDTARANEQAAWKIYRRMIDALLAEGA